MKFDLVTDFNLNSTQAKASQQLIEQAKRGERNQVLLGVTGSGKTFTMANVIAKLNRPTIIMAHNKTLAAQLYGEMKQFFPNNHVEYFVSFYDYYQPEAYVAKTDTFIEKESSINEHIDRMRHSATRNLLLSRDVIIVASVSCIYGIGDATDYKDLSIGLAIQDRIQPQQLARQLTEIQYKRSKFELIRGSFRINGDSLELFPSHLQDRAWRLSFFGDELESITVFDPLTGEVIEAISSIQIFPNNHYVIPKPSLKRAITNIKLELKGRLLEFEKQGKLLERQRLKERITFDLEMLEANGFCPGIENYSRHLTGRELGSATPTIFEYLPKDALLFVDESHVSIPQIRGMYKGDFARKSNLAKYGFRLESCLDNRPLKFEEWLEIRPQTIFVSATPGDFETDLSEGAVVEQLVRPTGLVDPIIDIRPAINQVADVVAEIKQTINGHNRSLVTTLTKKLAEDLTEYLLENGIRAIYLHSDVDTLERIRIIRELREGQFDVLVGINLLREGLDIPECALVAILDADKEGFLRSRTSLIQTIGRASRNVEGRVLLYADKITDSIKLATSESLRRREYQLNYNKEHNIKPKNIKSSIYNSLASIYGDNLKTRKIDDKYKALTLAKWLEKLNKNMLKAATELEFEIAVEIRNEIAKLEHYDASLPLSVLPINYEIGQGFEKSDEKLSNREQAKKKAKMRARAITIARKKAATKRRYS